MGVVAVAVGQTFVAPGTLMRRVQEIEIALHQAVQEGGLLARVRRVEELLFAPAVQLGLTATPKRQNNADTYAYFGEPVYIYSLKEGVNDGYLTPFKVKQIQTTMDDYIYTPDDAVIEGEIDEEKRYEEADFNKIIEIKEREQKRVEIFMQEIDQREKTLVFCATQVVNSQLVDISKFNIFTSGS